MLGLLVVVELAFDPCGGTVEQVDGRPQQVFQVRFEAGIAQSGDQGVEDVGDGSGDGGAVGQRPGIGFVLEGAVAVKLEFGEDMGGLGGGVPGDMALSFVGSAAPAAAFMATDSRGRPGPAPAAKRRAAATRRMAEAGSFASRCKGGAAAGGKDPNAAIAGPGRLRPDRPLEGRGAAPSGKPGEALCRNGPDPRHALPSLPATAASP